MFSKIRYYQDKWHAEIEDYVKVMEKIRHVHSDVEDVKTLLEDFKKG